MSPCSSGKIPVGTRKRSTLVVPDLSLEMFQGLVLVTLVVVDHLPGQGRVLKCGHITQVVLTVL